MKKLSALVVALLASASFTVAAQATGNTAKPADKAEAKSEVTKEDGKKTKKSAKAKKDDKADAGKTEAPKK